jgi:hypothetical protein
MRADRYYVTVASRNRDGWQPPACEMVKVEDYDALLKTVRALEAVVKDQEASLVRSRPIARSKGQP